MANAITAATLSFLRWWACELKGLVPRAVYAPLGRYQRRLVLAVEGARLRLFAERGGQLEDIAPGIAAIASPEDACDEALLRLAEAAKARPGTPVVLRFGAEDCFARTLQLPAAAERDFARILDLDLERTTPFRRDDVLTAHYVDASAPAASGKRCVRHIVVKRRSIEPLTERLRDFGLTATSADCWNETRSGGLPVELLSGASARDVRSRWRTKRLPGLAALTALLMVSALAIHVIRHESALQSLEAEAAIAMAEAQKVRQALDTAQAVYAQIATVERLSRERVSAARIIDELTAVLPDTAWVYDLRIDSGMVEFTGFARSAAALIPVLEQSKLFTAATLTAPVVLDGGEDKERFSIRVRLRDVPEPKPETQTAATGNGEL